MLRDCGESIPLPASFLFPWDQNNTVSNVTVLAGGVIDLQCGSSFVNCGRLELFKYLYSNANKDIYYLLEDDHQFDGSSQKLIISFETVDFLTPDPDQSYCDRQSQTKACTFQQIRANGQITLSKTSIQFCFGDNNYTSSNGYMLYKAGYQNHTHSTSWRGFRPLADLDKDGWARSIPRNMCEVIPLSAPSLASLPTDFGGFQSLAKDSTAVRMDVADCQSTRRHFWTGEDYDCGESVPSDAFNLDWDNNHTVSNITVQRDGFVYVQCITASGEKVDCGRVSLFTSAFSYARSTNTPMDIFYTFQESSQEGIKDDALIVSWENVQVGWADEEYMLNFQVILSSTG
ncbi:MAG: hypothetical protein SGBAC_012288, partial [Bacillariaceae sp.]